MSNPVEIWKSEKHGFDVWPEVERHAAAGTPMKQIDQADLERMKWYGFFYRKRDLPGRYMNRIRLTAGELTAPQAKAIAHLACDLGHGVIDITTRANVQVQGLDVGHLPEAAKRLARVGLSSKQTGHDNIRNVFAHPFSGLMPDELIDTRGLCHEITSIFLDSREYSDLPRKMNICLNGTENHSAHFWTQDISFLAARRSGGEIAFHALIGGTQGQTPHLAWRLPVWVEPGQVVEVTRAILDLFRAEGSREKRNAARFRFLIEAIGVEGVMNRLESRLPFCLQPCLDAPAPARSYDDLIGWFPQKAPGLWTMGLSVPLGRMTWRQLEGLAVLSRKWADGQLRTTHEQGIAVINVPTRHRGGAATDAAALGLSVHADSLDRNSMACTGSQFCNIAVTETKGHMFQLLEKLRKKQVKLEGVRIHMSGCPSSCAQHFTADIGLKGVRVRRLLGTREGFDVFLGGGAGGQIEMGRAYRLGVDVDQLPALVEEVVGEYYVHHRPGQTFSAYWRERLGDASRTDDGAKAGEDDYRPPVWICEKCQHRHLGVDPPMFCPSCAGLRRFFARLEEHSSETVGVITPPAERPDGYVFAADESAVQSESGLAVTVAGHELALFRVAGQVRAVAALCPHEGAPLAQGTIENGVITCPWHGWTFDACSGCSLEPANHRLDRHEVLVEDGKVFVRVGRGSAPNHEQPSSERRSGSQQPAAAKAVCQPRPTQAAVATLSVADVIQETPDVRTFRLDNSGRKIPLERPGQFVSVCATIDGRDVWRSFTVCSSPARPEGLDLTIKLNPDGQVSRHLFETIRPGSRLKLRGPQGRFYFDPTRHDEPLALISAGSGITPMMSIARFLRDTGDGRSCVFVYGARTADDIILHRDCGQLVAQMPGFRYYVTLSQAGAGWTGACGRIDAERLGEWIDDLAARRCFLCGPDQFLDQIRAGLLAAGVAEERIHTEAFHSREPARV
ncbi:MAG TPA: Rieske 2Fe-2S domain-containing protein [Pirellulales bacterium]|nr:Rieske 2Fe-2S domain-containing protein [Pirellulales bacterium]